MAESGRVEGEIARCAWTKNNPLANEYHDREWGVPCRDDQKLFEYIVLDTFQAGLSWQIILNKREGLRKAFANFDAHKIAKFGEKEAAELVTDASIIRNRLKILGTINNAQAFLKTQAEFGEFWKYIWDFVDNKTIIHTHKHTSELGATSPESDAMSKDMKKRGFKFCGSTVCYAFMQAAGLVNDHTTDCFRYSECVRLAGNAA
jgi:DNA-3-methyladenine glycosylase I